MSKGKKVKEAVEGLKEQGFPVYVGQWMPCPVCKVPWRFHKADRTREKMPPILMCPEYPSTLPQHIWMI